MPPIRQPALDAAMEFGQNNTMTPEQESKLEAALDRELKALPPLKAPGTLAPAVMAVLAARARLPWWQRAWWDWPVAAKAAFVILTLSVAGLVSGGTLFLEDNAVDYSSNLVERVSVLGVVLDVVTPFFWVAHLVWEKMAQPFLLYALVCLGALYLTCVGVGTACYRYALKRI